MNWIWFKCFRNCFYFYLFFKFADGSSLAWRLLLSERKWASSRLPVVSRMWLISGWSVWVMLATMFLCDRDTPLDRPVVPLEYGINATSPLLRADRDPVSDVSTDGSIISPKSHVPSGREPSKLTDTTNSGCLPGPATDRCASVTLDSSPATVTTPTAPESLNWWAISTKKSKQKLKKNQRKITDSSHATESGRLDVLAPQASLPVRPSIIRFVPVIEARENCSSRTPKYYILRTCPPRLYTFIQKPTVQP